MPSAPAPNAGAPDAGASDAETHDATAPAREKERLHPRNPWFGLYFAALLLGAAVLGAVVLVDQFERVVGGDIQGQRSEGFLFLGPFAFGAIGVITLVRALRAFRPWLDYRARTDLEQRRADKAVDLVGQKRWPLVLFGLFALAGWVVLRILEGRTQVGAVLLVEFRVLALLIWTATLGLLGQCLYYSRLLPHSAIGSSGAAEVAPGGRGRDTL